ncbi:hypothetical protein Fmac_009837 [Flemingia macrophylla]|uniref:Uncharacterized protein n=1 Tax=Flemingia macrophylla TaxID=520843 RepID=A0ABD1N284_9FABA
MARMKEQREHDAEELAALKRENSLLRAEQETIEYSSSSWHESTSRHMKRTHSMRENTRVQSSIQGQAGRGLASFSHHHLFTPRIMATSLLENWKALPLEKYDGSSDPDEHVNMYLTQVTLIVQDDATICRIFPTTLKGRALNCVGLAGSCP